MKASTLGQLLDLDTDRQGRIRVNRDLSVPQHSNVFVAGDQAHFEIDGEVLPGVAPVAIQQGRHFAKLVKAELNGNPRPEFSYYDKGIMATIGRNKAVVQSGRWQMTGWFAWVMWLVVHIYFLTGFRNRLFVVLQWAWSYMTYRRGARLIVGEKRNPAKVTSEF